MEHRFHPASFRILEEGGVIVGSPGGKAGGMEGVDFCSGARAEAAYRNADVVEELHRGYTSCLSSAAERL